MITFKTQEEFEDAVMRVVKRKLRVRVDTKSQGHDHLIVVNLFERNGQEFEKDSGRISTWYSSQTRY